MTKVVVEKVPRQQIANLISGAEHVVMSHQDQLVYCNVLTMSASMWVGTVDGKLVCFWGLIPPSLMSEQAHLWLYTAEDVKDHEFLFIRYSQRAIEDALEEFPHITGFTRVGNDKAIRWLKWLGAEFGEPGFEGKVIPFKIVKGSSK